ncbi:MAG: hypothetical protein Q8O41_10975 [Candidatus Methanoperedens sp.]|nr:hypothetical protein [Candidatus Methanoperedens sp.]
MVRSIRYQSVTRLPGRMLDACALLFFRVHPHEPEHGWYRLSGYALILGTVRIISIVNITISKIKGTADERPESRLGEGASTYACGHTCLCITAGITQMNADSLIFVFICAKLR